MPRWAKNPSIDGLKSDLLRALGRELGTRGHLAKLLAAIEDPATTDLGTAHAAARRYLDEIDGKHPRGKASGAELEALRAIARAGRTLEDAILGVWMTLGDLRTKGDRRAAEGSGNTRNDLDDLGWAFDDHAPPGALPKAAEAKLAALSSARSAIDVALHAWEWFHWNEDGSRGEKKEPRR